MQQPNQPPFDYQNNQQALFPQTYYSNGYNMQQVPINGANNYYNSTSINTSFTYNVNEPYNSFMVPTNMPYINGPMVQSTNDFNLNFNNNSYMQPSSTYSINNMQIPQQPLSNAYFSHEYNIQSLSNNMCYSNKYTSTIPLHLNPPNNFHTSPENCLNNQYVQSNQNHNITEKPKQVDEWFDMTSKFLNNKPVQKRSLSPNKSSPTNSKSINRSQTPKHNRNKNKSKTTKSEEISTEIKKLSNIFIEQIIELEQKKCCQSVPTDLYYKNPDDINVTFGNDIVQDVCNEFEKVLGTRASKVKALKPIYNKPRKNNVKVHKCSFNNCPADDSSTSEDEEDDKDISTLNELDRKSAHPDRLHPELWYNEFGEMNDGPMCKCSVKSQRSGIRHNIYVGEGPFEPCIQNSNNANKLFHYRITITPPTNFLLKSPTIIEHDNKKYIFEGFSLLSHYSIPPLPTSKVIRFNTNYAILYIEEKIPDNFTIRELTLFYDYLYYVLLK